MEETTAQHIWEAALGELQVQVSRANYQTWLEGTKGLSYHDGEFVVAAPNNFVAEYLDLKQRSLIQKTLIGIIGKKIAVTFQVNDTIVHTHQEAVPPQEAACGFNPRYTFESFITGESNRMAHAAALAVVEEPGQHYNPLFLYGGPGLGKTHLLHAIGHMSQASRHKALYVSGEQFTNEFIQAIQLKRTEEFRQKYRQVDMLLIDDIHFISGKEQTQECFFHTFNDLHNQDHQIVVSCDRPPKDMPLIEERLCSRFHWGLVVDIQPPDLETRLAILNMKAEEEGHKLDADVVRFIADHIERNVRELEGGLNRVVAYCHLLKTLATPDLAAKALKSLAATPAHGSAAPPAAILGAVAQAFGISPPQLTGRKRDKETALARQVAMYLIREETGCSLAQAGAGVGGRKPATVKHACDHVRTEMEASAYLSRRVADIRAALHP